VSEERKLLAKAYRDNGDLGAADYIEAGRDLTPDTQIALLAIRDALAAQPPQPQREGIPGWFKAALRASAESGNDLIVSQSEAQAVLASLPAAASVEAGERAQIVAWLRSEEPDSILVECLAKAIERGDHLTAKGKDQADG